MISMGYDLSILQASSQLFFFSRLLRHRSTTLMRNTNTYSNPFKQSATLRELRFLLHQSGTTNRSTPPPSVVSSNEIVVIACGFMHWRRRASPLFIKRAAVEVFVPHTQTAALSPWTRRCMNDVFKRFHGIDRGRGARTNITFSKSRIKNKWRR